MKTMFGWLFSFCFLHETVFGNGQIAITHNSEIAAMRKYPATGRITATSIKINNKKKK